jgi:hypothetical protein
MTDWLHKCDIIERLNFGASSKINECLNGANKGYFPISMEKLKVDNMKLYEQIMTII